MNVSRLVASIGGYVFSTSDDGVAIHLYGGFETTAEIGGQKVGIRETSDYPWSGDIRIVVEPDAPAAFALKLRVPGWARGFSAAGGAGYEYNVALIGMCLALMLTGGGRLAVDQLLFARRAASARQPAPPPVVPPAPPPAAPAAV